MMRKILALLLCCCLLSGLFGLALAQEPLQVIFSTEQTSVRVGDTVKVNWTIVGGQAPFECVLFWNAIQIGDDYQEYDGRNGSAEFVVREGMQQEITFALSVTANNQAHLTKSFASSDQGIVINNLDGWPYGKTDTFVTLEHSCVQVGKPIRATIYKAYDIGAGGYMGGYAQFETFVSKGRASQSKKMPLLYQYRQEVSFTPSKGIYGHLKVVADAYSSADITPTSTITSDRFAILKKAPPVCGIKLATQRVPVGMALSAMYELNGSYEGKRAASAMDITTWWEFVDRDGVLTEMNKTQNAPASAEVHQAFPSPGRARLVVDTRPQDAKADEVFPAYWSEWVVVDPATEESVQKTNVLEPGGNAGQETANIAPAVETTRNYHWDASGEYGLLPISIDLKVNQHELKSGDKLRLDWQISGGQPPYQSLLYWFEQDEVYQEGPEGSAELTILPDTQKDITFRLVVVDAQDNDNHFSLSSEDLGISISRMD